MKSNKNTNPDYSEYLEAGREIFKELFGKKALTELESNPIKCFKWNGLDITTAQIRATTFGVAERFSPERLEYYEDSNTNPLQLFMGVMFHYGYQQCVDTNEQSNRTRDFAISMMQSSIGHLEDENKELKKQLNITP